MRRLLHLQQALFSSIGFAATTLQTGLHVATTTPSLLGAAVQPSRGGSGAVHTAVCLGLGLLGSAIGEAARQAVQLAPRGFLTRHQICHDSFADIFVNFDNYGVCFDCRLAVTAC